ncbi:hypothetical protein LTR10_023780 [Elasticomyces elasticus]|uniref:Uncharacterized protein n=1 Tax=Exophiala sideris TaxID=1016849 RepID=A0ABR0JHX7_9EURO|nr:hypothetical protein LTR10_023780 [Elasticomyces elasticus]KAK5034200.1 hypothetical protein LTS07_003120 [Exophiala sideris]KAK5042496.1 hypothetical protein LTR13_001343 [Exophiala sideris]KAK5065578.1 hypothetical protein LTR69_003127 [Exophiala sideris]KAK5185964.1 hypothetical protein LTR44_002013 [Eurotiomycetes sp. CCFEE 6388]
MSSTMLKTVLLTTLLATSHAFVPVDIQPLPSDLDTNKWSAVTTLTEGIPSLALSTPTPTPDIQILPVLDANIVPELKRQATGQNNGATTTAVTQISPVTTYLANSYIGGVATQVAVVYTQTFAAVPDQWPSYTAGSIGLGTLTGTIGVVKSKRSLPTQMPMGSEGDDQLLPWIMKKLVGTAKEEQEKIVEDLQKEGEKLKTFIHDQEEGLQPKVKAEADSTRTVTLLPPISQNAGSSNVAGHPHPHASWIVDRPW